MPPSHSGKPAQLAFIPPVDDPPSVEVDPALVPPAPEEAVEVVAFVTPLVALVLPMLVPPVLLLLVLLLLVLLLALLVLLVLLTPMVAIAAVAPPPLLDPDPGE